MKSAIKAILVVLALLTVVPSTAEAAGQYNWANGCFSVPMVQRCWATNLDPNAGPFGSQMRTDNLNSLPTWSGVLSYGSPALPATTCGGDPLFGGDHVGAGSNANCGTSPPTCSYPAGISCHPTPATFVTQNFAGPDGVWGFAMGGGDKCMSDGNSVPCNLQHKIYPYDCAVALPGCSSAGPQNAPFSWAFPAGMRFEMKTLLHVSSVTGPWHHFLCANLLNAVSGAVIEICNETFRSGGGKVAAHPVCNRPDFVTWWQAASTTTPYMNSFGTWITTAGVHTTSHWRMTRDQFIALLGHFAATCPGFVADYAMDNWRLFYSQNGMEISGVAGYGTAIDWQIADETMITWY